MKLKLLVLTVLTVLFIISCQSSGEDVYLEDSSSKEIAAKEPVYIDLGDTSRKISFSSGDELFKSSEKREVALYMAEYITSGDNGEMGNTIFFGAMDKGNKQLGGDFVPGLSIDGTDAISYYVDENNPSDDLDVGITSNAIDRAMGTWENVTCSNLGLNKVPYDGRTTGFIAALLGYPGSFTYVADVNHVGWMPAAFFDFLAPGGSNFILGVTFTLVFEDENGNLIDTDKNGKYDVAFREIYYNEAFQWNDGGHYDVETIALHEAGHGLSQAHFGKAFAQGENPDDPRWKVHFAPRAVMNAAYSGIQTSIEKTDNAGHCSNWGQWPNN